MHESAMLLVPEIRFGRTRSIIRQTTRSSFNLVAFTKRRGEQHVMS